MSLLEGAVLHAGGDEECEPGKDTGEYDEDEQAIVAIELPNSKGALEEERNRYAEEDGGDARGHLSKPSCAGARHSRRYPRRTGGNGSDAGFGHTAGEVALYEIIE